MGEDLIKPVGGAEPHVTFKLESDRDIWEITNPNVQDALIRISGYDLQFWINRQYLSSVEEIESALNGLRDLFRELILEQILDKTKPPTDD